jgi:putative AbiEii toxin of type IV toxin-antitoxin system
MAGFHTSDPLASGSHWRRWNPHLHAPGTLLNDQFAGDWNGYLAAIETAAPVVEVLGVTDYFSIGCYKAVRVRQRDGRLPNVRLLFPNVEMRLNLETEKKRGVNLHLLFSPDNSDHESQIERVMAELTFEYKGRKYRCTDGDLLLLGRAHNAAATNDDAARKEGANQFKATLDQLREMFRGDAWIARNCIVAVAASNHDGTAGLQKDSSFDALRREVERFAQVIFAATPSTRDFWLGKNANCDPKRLDAEYGGKKPCLHGCDAHSVAKTCAPDETRHCWIKGDPTFESLRQALLEPEERVWVGAAAPDRHDASMCIAKVQTRNTPWLINGEIALNPGLVAIIGSRGSGKTALADIIAIGANVTSPLDLESSFLSRASRPLNHLGEAEVELNWGDGTSVTRTLLPEEFDGESRSGEGVRYLSQQFVEQLCSAEGLADELRHEIERVIFEATNATERFDADSFEQLAEIHLNPILRQRQVAKDAIENTSAEINAEDALHNRLAAIKKDRDDRQKRIDKTKADMKELLPKGKEERTKRLAELEAAFATATTAIDKQKRVLVRVQDLEKEVVQIRKTLALQQLTALRNNYQDAGLSDAQWQEFGMVFKGDVDTILAQRKKAIAQQINQMTESVPGVTVDTVNDPPSTWPYNTLLAERNKVKNEVGIDAQKQKRYGELQRALEIDERHLQRLTADLTNAEGAAGRRKSHIERRRGLYVEVFQSYLDERQVLERLYGPLQRALVEASGSLNRLRFAVSREITLKAWIEKGEKLLDLRKESKLRGHGALEKEAERLLMAAWKAGTAEEVGAAMQTFIQELLNEFKKSRPPNITEARTPEWMQQIASWLYNTDHIEMRYSVTYDGVAIEHLSPGTRGIVLLLLYLVIDKHDRRPLIIDQPEESLDPKSVFDELVPHFREARKRRQVVIVTHNANLVVNTDADQVIVASSERNASGGLPSVTYASGSIENPKIRTAVCEILEGGERAFLDRERRYRLHWHA